MKLAHKKILILTAGAIVLAAGSAAIASYTTRETVESKAESKPVVAHAEVYHHRHTQRMAAAQPAQPACNDHNIVGTVAGGAVGGIAGSQVGRGNGKTAATIVGTLGGAYLGNQYVPTRNVTCGH